MVQERGLDDCTGHWMTLESAWSCKILLRSALTWVCIGPLMNRKWPWNTSAQQRQKKKKGLLRVVLHYMLVSVVICGLRPSTSCWFSLWECGLQRFIKTVADEIWDFLPHPAAKKHFFMSLDLCTLILKQTNHCCLKCFCLLQICLDWH